MYNLDGHEIFLPHQQMMLSNCVGQGSIQEIENSLSVSIRRGFNREFDIFKIVGRAGEAEKSGSCHSLDFVLFRFKITLPGLPWWCSGWESACQRRGHGFEPWSGKIPHAVEQLGPWATTTEPACLEPVLHNKRGHDGERPAHHDEEWPLLVATRERPCTETKTQHSQKLIN